MVTTGAITFYLRVHCYNYSSDSVRAYDLQQLLCITYALTPYGSKVVIYGGRTPQYQVYRGKILIGSYLKDLIGCFAIRPGYNSANCQSIKLTITQLLVGLN